ncbi:MAG: nicotinamide riboside transporter PnuC [Bacteroidales bacterium]|jgi:nicotinamide mononucleotide transporter|nr:nicotinamide riboside transporter PnuC [Bacteroidales bacterium]
MDLTALIDIGPFKTSFIELIAVAFGLFCVWFMKKESVLVFPFGIVNVLIYVYIFFTARLYANAAINGFFFIGSVYGWYSWTRKDTNDKTIRITQCSKLEILLNSLAIIVFFLIIRIVLIRYTTSQIPTWDAITTSVYMVAQWLLSRKKIENWILWISADFIMIVICAVEGLYFSSFQYFVFTIIAVLGFLEWRIKLIK